jgi:hypothetical protein
MEFPSIIMMNNLHMNTKQPITWLKSDIVLSWYAGAFKSFFVSKNYYQTTLKTWG